MRSSLIIPVCYRPNCPGRCRGGGAAVWFRVHQATAANAANAELTIMRQANAADSLSTVSDMDGSCTYGQTSARPEWPTLRRVIMLGYV